MKILVGCSYGLRLDYVSFSVYNGQINHHRPFEQDLVPITCLQIDGVKEVQIIFGSN